jgi:CHAT domain-containing protein
MRRFVLALSLALFALPTHAQPDCAALFERAQEALETFDPRAADSLAATATRGALQRARACYAAQPALDTTAANNFARTFGREVQVLWETRRPEAATALTEDFLSGPHLRADSAGVRYLLEWRAFMLDQQDEVEAAAQTRVQLLDYMPSASPAVRTRIWMDLGSNYSRLGWWDDALAIYQSVQEELGDQLELEPALRAGLARALTKEAEVRLYQSHIAGNVSRSLEAARQAVRLMERGDSPREQHRLVFSLLGLLEALRIDGQYEAALDVGRRATELAGQLERPAPGAEALGWELTGRVLLHLDRFGEARTAFEQALAVMEGSGVRTSQLEALDGIALAAMRAGEYPLADSLVERTLHLVEAERASASTAAEQGRSAFWYPYYMTRVSLLLLENRDAEAFLALDQARARVLRDLRRRRADQLSPDAQRLSDSLATALGELHTRLTASDLPRADRLRLRRRVNELELARAALYDASADLQGVTLPRLQAALAEREQVLVSYHLGEPAYAFVLRPDTLVAVPLDATLDGNRVRALMEAVSPQWSRADGPISIANASFELAPLKTLYDLLFAPVAPHIPDGASLVVVPEGPLANLPFGLLVEANPGRFQFADAPYLLRRHPISTELAAALLLDAPLAPASRLVAFGRSEFGGGAAGDSLRLAREDEALPDLPSVVREMESLAERFPSAHVALDGAATESSFYQLAGDARLLHLASHALVADAEPLSSYVQLTPDPDGTEDGRLHLYELMNRPLSAALVVLSGCRTARGRDLSGEGTLGLHYAVRAAGAESSLGTLWRVDDAATVELMDRFYDHLARGARKDVALQRAQVEYLDHNDGFRASPFFWAAPVLYGDPRPVPLPSAPSSWWWIVGGGLLLLAFLVPFARRRFASP